MTVLRYPNSVCEVSVCQCAKDGADCRSILETGLPWAVDLPARLLVVHPVSLSERGLGKQPSKKHNVVAFHDDDQRHHDRPEDGPGISFDALHQCHMLFGGDAPSVAMVVLQFDMLDSGVRLLLHLQFDSVDVDDS